MIAEVVPLAPAAGALAFLVIDFALVVAIITLWGLKYGYNYSLGAILRGVSMLVGSIPLVGGFASREIDKVDHWILAQLSQGIIKAGNGLSLFWHGTEALARYTVDSVEWIAAETLHGFRMVRDSFVPNAIRDGVAHLGKGIDSLGARVRAAELAAAQRLTRGIDRLQHEIDATLRHAQASVRAAEARLAAGIAASGAAIGSEVADLRGYVYGGLTRRLDHLGRIATTGVVALAGVQALSALMGILRCSNVQKAGKALCRTDSNLLDSLLLDTLAIASLLSVVEFARALQGVQGEVTPLVLGGIKETRNLPGL